MKDDILTSVKVDITNFDLFKIECVRQKFSLKKLVDTTIFMYLTDKEFKKRVTELSLQNNLKVDESSGEKKDTTNI